MRFAVLPLREAAGAIVAHTVRAGTHVVKKGTPVTAELVDTLAGAGLSDILVAALDPCDVGEDEAARRLAQAVAGPGLRLDRAFTGRCNLFAEADGVLLVDAEAVRRINGIDEAVTLATLPAFAALEAGTMAATVKIIPYAVPGATLDLALAAAHGALRLAPYAGLKAAYIATTTDALKPSVRAKTREVTLARLKAAGATLAAEAEVPHETGALSAALGSLPAGIDLVIVFGASAIADRQDIVPAALVEAGGTIERLGMPVDPGNLMLLGTLGGRPVVGAPGCARSPKENGFDWVLRRLCARLPVTGADIEAMGVGGLLMEIRSRPQPREGSA